MKKQADLILYNGVIQTADERLSVVTALAIREGIIIGTGTDVQVKQHFSSSRNIDLKGQFVYPGLIDAHCHFFGYARTVKAMAPLAACKSIEEVVDVLRDFQAAHQPAWLCGRGWDQNKWAHKVFPDNNLINIAFPDIPVVLIRVDGHAVLANQAAINAIGLTESNIRAKAEARYNNGVFTGLFFEGTADLFKNAVPRPGNASLQQSLLDAQQECFSLGLTSLADAGLEKHQIDLLDSMQQSGQLKLRIYAMLEPTEENIGTFLSKGIYQTDRLHVRSVKLYADGALGSRGACLLEPYSDDPGNHGIMVVDPEKLDRICELAIEHHFQVNTHCIGDSANRYILNTYARFLKGKNDLRWRIEHAQVVNPADFHMYGDYSIIPSIQGTHATSDMYWAGNRLGPERIKSAYAYKTLLAQNAWIANGTDFPVEKINPMLTFFASVARQDLEAFPEEGFQVENALSREECLLSMTRWAAKACFEESRKGSLEVGKYADFIVLDLDMLTAPLNQVPDAKVLETWVNGEQVFLRGKVGHQGK